MMCDELIETPLEHEHEFIDILNHTLESYTEHNQTPQHIVQIITSYIFANEYYFRRDCHTIDIAQHTITLYLYRSKHCINLYKLTIPIYGASFLHLIDSIYSVESTPNSDPRAIDSIDSPKLMSAWIDTECKDDLFSNSKAANMIPNACFLMMTYFEENRQNITPWLVQWKYDDIHQPYLQVIARIISYPSDWNYVTISYKHNVSVVFYTSMEQHTINFIPQIDSNDNDTCVYKEKVSIIKFGSGLNYPWLMFGSSATKILCYDDILSLFGTASSPLLMNTIDKESEYFVTRSCKDFIEMKDHGAFWTTSRDHISIFQITEQRDYVQKLVYDEEHKEQDVDLKVQSQLRIFNNVDNNDNINNNIDNILDVTVTNDWSAIFQRKYDIEHNHKLFMVLYTEIKHRAKITELYACYIDVRGAEINMLHNVKLASSNCLTKFLVGRGCYQTVYNDWVCTLIGVDESNHEARHQLRLTEQLELLHHQKVKRNEGVQEVTHRYRCKALKWFKRAKKEELEMLKVNEAPSTAQVVWDQIVSSRHLILSTLLGAYVGWRVTRMMRSGRWTFRFGF